MLVGLHDRNQLDPGVFLLRADEAGSRSRARGIDFRLASATYDEWGIFIAALFQIEPTAIIGPYDDAFDFMRQTDGAYHGEFVIAELP